MCVWGEGGGAGELAWGVGKCGVGLGSARSYGSQLTDDGIPMRLCRGIHKGVYADNAYPSRIDNPVWSKSWRSFHSAVIVSITALQCNINIRAAA